MKVGAWPWSGERGHPAPLIRDRPAVAERGRVRRHRERHLCLARLVGAQQASEVDVRKRVAVNDEEAVAEQRQRPAGTTRGAQDDRFPGVSDPDSDCGAAADVPRDRVGAVVQVEHGGRHPLLGQPPKLTHNHRHPGHRHRWFGSDVRQRRKPSAETGRQDERGGKGTGHGCESRVSG